MRLRLIKRYETLYELNCFFHEQFCINVVFVFFFRYLTDTVAPGNRVTILGVYSIKRAGPSKPGKVQILHFRELQETDLLATF